MNKPKTNCKIPLAKAHDWYGGAMVSRNSRNDKAFQENFPESMEYKPRGIAYEKITYRDGKRIVLERR